MEAYQKRVVEEKQRVDSDLAKLLRFLEGEGVVNVAPGELGRMQRQASIMKQYSGVLGERIAAFPKDEADNG